MTIKELRQKFILSQNDLAVAVGIPRSSIRNYENGICVPKQEIIDRIQSHYGVEIDINPSEISDPNSLVIYIQSPMGGNISVDEIRDRVGDVEQVYVRVDHNKLYWVNGKETGSVDIW